jgi:hypothetical protein
LSEEETERLDELSITDDEIAWRLRGVEDDLVDAYVGGSLEGDTLERFESFYLSSPRRRERVKFAANLRRAVEKAAPPEVVAVPLGKPAAAREAATDVVGRAGYMGVWKWAAAAAVVVSIGGAWAVEEVRLRRGLDEARKETAALDQRARDLEQQLAVARAVTPAAAVSPERPDRVVAQAQPVEAVALMLLPQTRSVTSLATLNEPKGVEYVRIDLRLESNDFASYQAALRDPATGRIVWRSTWIEAPAASPRAAVSIRVPANVLKLQHYALELSGRRAGAASDVVSSYAFEVVHR